MAVFPLISETVAETFTFEVDAEGAQIDQDIKDFDARNVLIGLNGVATGTISYTSNLIVDDIPVGTVFKLILANLNADTSNVSATQITVTAPNGTDYVFDAATEYVTFMVVKAANNATSINTVVEVDDFFSVAAKTATIA